MEADRGFVVGIGCLSSSAKWLYFYPVTLSDRESESELVLISDWLRPQGQARRRVVAGSCWAAASQAQSFRNTRTMNAR